LIKVEKETLGEIHPSTAEAFEHLALAYVKQGMTDDAIKTYTKAVDIRKTMVANGNPRRKELVVTLQLLKREKKAAQTGTGNEGAGRFRKGEIAPPRGAEYLPGNLYGSSQF